MAAATPLPPYSLMQAATGSEAWAPRDLCQQQLFANSQPCQSQLLRQDFVSLEDWQLTQATQLQHSDSSTRPSELNSGVYKTDEFRMYSFKVRRCPKAPAHDWTDCPYCHPGEKAKRRDPRKYAYTGIACPDFRKATCKRGDACPYAHGVFECWLHPSRYRTQLCKDGEACTRSVCFFAHNLQELRPGLLQASLSQEWRPKAFYPAPPSPTAPPLLSSEEGSPRSLGAKSSPTEADLLQNLMPSPGSSYGSYSQLQHAAAACNAGSLYNLSQGETQHLLAHGLPQQTEQPLQQKPHSQAQLQDISEAMRMLSLAAPAKFDVANGRAQEVTQAKALNQMPPLSLPASSQELLSSPARRRAFNLASSPAVSSPFTAIPIHYPGHGQGSPTLPSQSSSAINQQWMQYLQASNPAVVCSPPASVPQSMDPRWMELLAPPFRQSSTPAGVPPSFAPEPLSRASW